ncbi:TetR/AcrR family transcriptional regulator [Quadrisphaera sp. INWT6]|uniref:TetR/AcrR family transcriptional regulator n=1 Tax=Quadrisphaera sp. INWT6 TaxID=2596917 RepID=UPI0019D53DE4|nr:TetR/AcrR family transcriptional regulator [Quadrisphaera sp. INWT6]
MEVPERRRDAGRTRQRLLDAARGRFAADGFSSTTVRQVADEAGVDVALIKRYFGSKEGLFEACLAAAVDDLRAPADDGAEHADLAARLAHHALGAGVSGAASGQALMLLLRSSGDEAVDDLRRRVLGEHSERLARRLAPGGGDGAAVSPVELLTAQVALAAVVGVAVLRSSPGLEPLRAAEPAQLAALLRRLLDTPES